MIKMGEITCRIPRDGIKAEILYCTEPEGYRLDIWTVGIALVMAVLTTLLFLVAFFALRTAKRSLKQMQWDSDKQWDSVREQIKEQDRIATAAAAASRDLALDQLQTQYLVTHLQAIRTMQMKARDAEIDMIEVLSEVTISWAAWSMFLADKHHEFLSLTQEYSDDLIAVTQFVREQTLAYGRGEISESDLRLPLDRWGDLVGNYIGNLSHWQALPALRYEKQENIRYNLNLMKKSFPNVLNTEARVS